MPQYCTILHKITALTLDGDDATREPDSIPLNATVTLTPLLEDGDSVIVTTSTNTESIVLEPIEAKLTGGEIYHRGEPGILIFAGGDDCNPPKIRYRATISNAIAGSTPVKLKNILFEAVPGGTINLASVQPVPAAPYPGYSVQYETAISKIDAHADDVIADVDSAVASNVAIIIKNLFSTTTAKIGQIPKWDGTKFIWSWLDQFTTKYDTKY